MAATITSTEFGALSDARPVSLFTLTNRSGLQVKITNYGARTTSIHAPDRNGQLGEVILGYDALAPYLEDSQYLGAAIGRYANRIAGGAFSLMGRRYTLPINNDPNHLHGGAGYHTRLWKARIDEARLILTLRDDDEANGYPGIVETQLTISLSDDNTLKYSFLAQSSAPTPINLTNHNYFNLSGGGDILSHHIQIYSDYMTPLDDHGVPTGRYALVDGTPYDLRALGQLSDQRGGVFDHNFCVRSYDGQLRPAARLYEPISGRLMMMHTSQPGVQLYTGANIPKLYAGRASADGPHSGLCLEGQHFPDSPNHPHFPSTIIMPGETYAETIAYKFSVITEAEH